jgi:hypothetical protein
MTIKDVLRPLPGTRRVSLLRQQLAFGGSAQYWERTYARGGTSGGGSYGALARAKAHVVNEFVRRNDIRSVTEFGCGDGHQLSLACYPRYVGLDVSPSAIDLCARQFAADTAKSFFLYDGARFIDRAGLFAADLALSMDVLYHLVEDHVYQTYLRHLFAAGQRYVLIYATNRELTGTAAHVRHRYFTPWVEENCPQWRLAWIGLGPNRGAGRADFFAYQRC